jgi:hypothetical protein
MPVVAPAPEIIEGTWEEVSRQSARLSGHRVRVVILPETEIDAPEATGRYAARMRPLLEEASRSPATPEERKAAEREVQELKDALNESRRRDGAEPVF